MHYAEVWKGRKQKGQLKAKWYYHIREKYSGQVVSPSEGYYSKWNAKRAIKKNHPDVSDIQDVVKL